MNFITNHPIEMPVELFNQAINAAHKMYDSHIEYEGSLEDIPAVKMICDWWNTTCPNLKLRRAGSFNIYVRDEEDHSKWESLQNGTIFDEDVWRQWSHRCAMPHNTANIIVEFFAFRSEFIVVGDQCTSIMVDGTTEKTMPLECADEAWESYSGLIQLEDVLAQDDKRKFDEAINALKKGEEVVFELVIPGL